MLGAEPLGIAIAPIRHRTFVRTTDAVVVVDWDPLAIRATLALASGVKDGIAYDAQYGVAYASAGDGTLAVITTPRADMPAITQTIALGVTPGALAVDERSHRVLALSGSSVVVVSGNTRRVEATLPLPGPAWGVAANAATGRAFVAGDGAGPRDSAYVRIYDLDSLREVTTIGVSHATSLALDQEQNFLYLAEPSTAAHYGRITVVDARLADASTFVSFAVDGMTAIAVDSTHSRIYYGQQNGELRLGGIRPGFVAPSDFSVSMRLGAPARVLAADARTRRLFAGLASGALVLLEDRFPG